MKEQLNKPYNTELFSPAWAGINLENKGKKLVGARIIRRLTSSGPDSPLALTDARFIRDEKNKDIGLGFQRAYLGVLPAAVDARMLWAKQPISTFQQWEDAQNAFSVTVKETEGRNKAILVTGGEHFHPDTVGSNEENVDPKKLALHGGYHPARDFITLSLINHAEENDLALIGICRGMQGALHYYSNGLVFPRDIHQEAHSFKNREKKIFNKHTVENIFYGDGKDYDGYHIPERPMLNIDLPRIEEVNSVHEQGYRRRDISKEVMQRLNENGIYPWLVANVDDVDYEDQVYEAWLVIKPTEDEKAGKVKGVLTQFHPEQQSFDIPQMMQMRLFMQDIVHNHVPIKKSDYAKAC